MKTIFVEMFLDDTIDLGIANALYLESPPTLDHLNQLAFQLNANEALDKLTILQTLLYCRMKERPELLSLLIQITSFILILAGLNQNDKIRLVEETKKLIDLIGDDTLQWQETLSRLSLACQKAEKTTLKLLFQHLPSEQLEKLYEQLLSGAETNPNLFLGLLEYILELRPHTLTNHTNIAHLKNLATSITLSPYPFSQKDYMVSMVFSNEEIINLMGNLQGLAISGSSSASSSTEISNTIYLEKYNGLINILVSRSTKNKADYLALITKNPGLANTLMTIRLQNPTNTIDHRKKLIAEILDEQERYDWNDATFKAATFKTCLAVFEKMPSQELIGCFIKYKQCHQPSEAIGLLNQLYELTLDAETILACIQAVDDLDKTFTILFITQDMRHDEHLIAACLKRLSIDELIEFAEMLLSARQFLLIDSDVLSRQFYQILPTLILDSNNSNTYLTRLAIKIHLLPEKIQLELISTLFETFEKKPLIYFQWLTALLEQRIFIDHPNLPQASSSLIPVSSYQEEDSRNKYHATSKTLLIAQCAKGLNLLKTPQQIKMLNKLTSEDFLILYLWVIKEKDTSQSQALINYLQTIQGQDHIYFLIANTPLIDPTFLKSLAHSIQNDKLLHLITSLLKKVRTSCEYSANLEQLFEIFCDRLKNSSDPNDPIHEWPNFTDDNNSLIQDWSFRLLKSPKCFFELTEERTNALIKYAAATYQSIRALFKIDTEEQKGAHDYAADLELRINRVLNLVQLTPTQTNQLALGLLSSFRTTPEKLQTIFSTLEKGKKSLNKNGLTNYNSLKKSCWTLLKPHLDYDAHLAEKQLSQSILTNTDFEPVLIKLATELEMQDDVSLAAHYLAQTVSNQFSHIEIKSLAAILANSTQIETIGNWQKVHNYFSSQTTKQNLTFIDYLINQTAKIKNNPPLIDQTWLFITSLEQFDTLLLQLSEDHLFWLVREAKPNLLSEHFPKWLSLLIENNLFDKINIGALLTLLPDDRLLLRTIYEQAALSDKLTPLFLQIDIQANAAIHFEYLLNRLINESNDCRYQFIANTQLLIQPSKINLNALVFINQILHRLERLNPKKMDDITLVLAHFRLIAGFAANLNQSSKNNVVVLRDLQQMIMRSIVWLLEVNQEWIVTLLQSESVSDIMLGWLRNKNDNDSGRIFFGKLLLENPSLNMDANVLVDPNYQSFLKELLLAPPAPLEGEQFIQHFNRLTPENQRALSETILENQTLCDNNLAALQTISRILPIQTLYDLYEKDKNRSYLIELLISHPNGLDQLSNVQTDGLIAQLNTGRQLLSILNGYSSPEIKTNFISNLYKYLRRNHISLSSWIERMNINQPTLVALTNFTHQEQDKEALSELINKIPFRLREIQNYLQNPCMDMLIENNSLLFQFLKHACLYPWQGWRCDPVLLRYLNVPSQKRASQANFELLNEVHHLETLFAPLRNGEQVMTQTLNAARWIYRLPLLATAIPETINIYQKLSPEIKSSLAQTDLVNQVIQPLIEKESNRRSPAPQLNNLNLLLESYLEQLNNTVNQYRTQLNARQKKSYSSSDEEQHELLHRHITHIHNCLSEFKQKQAIITHFSAEGLARLFNTNSYYSEAESSTSRSWGRLQKKVFITAHEEHNKWLHTNFPLDQQIDQFIELVKNNELMTQDKLYRNWVLRRVLFSELTSKIARPQLQSLLMFYPPLELTTELKSIHNSLNEFQKIFHNLLRLQPQSVHALVAYLYGSDLSELQDHQQALVFYHQPYLINLYELVIQAKKTGLSYNQIQSLIPDDLTNKNFEIEWIQIELAALEHLNCHLPERLLELAILGLSFNKDSFDFKRLISLSKSLLVEADNPSNLAQCMNSYQIAFEDKRNTGLCNRLLEILNEFNFPKAKSNRFFSSLKMDFIESILNLACKDPQHHESLIEKLIQAGYKTSSQRALEQTLTQILNTDSNNTKITKSLDQLSFTQWGNLTDKELLHCLAIQRLLYCMQPIDELAEWAKDKKDDGRAYFCAEASLIYSLSECNRPKSNEILESTLLERAKANLFKALQFLQNNSKWLVYQDLLADIQNKINIQEPAVYYHFLCSSFFFTGRIEPLIEQFILWITKLADTKRDNAYLIKALQIIIDAQACNLLYRSAEHLNPDTLNWLIRQCIAYQGESIILQEDIVASLPWQSIQHLIITNKVNPLALIKLILNNARHVQHILACQQNSLAFHQLLEQAKFPINELIHLLKIQSNPGIASLIAAQILCRQDYADRLLSEPFSEKNDKKRDPNKRLQPLINRICIEQLPSEVIRHFIPEAKASLFCSMKHFHQLGEYLHLLMPDNEKKISERIDYWLTHYLLMPNTDELLVELINKFPQMLLSSAMQLDTTKYNHLLMMVLKNYHRLTIPAISFIDALSSQHNERHLRYVIELLLVNQYNDTTLIQVLHKMLNNIMSKQPILELTTRQLLLHLDEQINCQEINNTLTQIRLLYVQQSARAGDCSMFYDKGQFNLIRAQKTVEASGHETSDIQPGILDKLSNIISSLKPDEDQNNSSDPCSIHLKSIDYFICHYQGNSNQLSLLLNHYLTRLVNKKHHQNKAIPLHSTASLLNSSDLHTDTRQVCFESILKHPGLFDNKIAAELLRYNATAAIQYYGQNQRYQDLINLCNYGANEFKKGNNQIQRLIESAGREARFEQSLSRVSGLFSGIRRWFKRCFFYGWNFWRFSPHLPQFVASYVEQPVAITPSLTSVCEILANQLATPPELTTLLQHFNPQAPVSSLTILTDAIQRFELKNHLTSELGIREQIDRCYSHLLDRAKDETAVDSWLYHHRDLFVANRKRLIGLYCKIAATEKLDRILEKADADGKIFSLIANELDESRPIELIKSNASTSNDNALVQSLSSASSSFIHSSQKKITRSYFWLHKQVLAPIFLKPMEKMVLEPLALVTGKESTSKTSFR